VTRTDRQDEWGPTWSPDGRWLAFNTSVRDRTSLQLYVARPDGTDGHVLSTSFAEFPSWSPGGEHIAFASMMSGRPGLNPDYDLRVIGADGSGERGLTHTPKTMEMFPQWSPDGAWIVYMAGPVGVDATSVWLMRADGGDPRRLTEPNTAVPSWSPDGRHIIYLDVAEDLVVMDLETGDQVELGLYALGFPEPGFASWTR
jgi:TolB protein